ncbi:hypothetical protein ACPZ19_04260 [Amycolatopsis lurida]
MTIQEAIRQVDTYLEQGRAALGTRATLTDDFRKDRMACDDPSDQGPAGRVFATRDAQVLGVDDPAKDEVFASLRKWWPSAGFRETAGQEDAIYAENGTDGFRMSLQANVKGQFYLGVSSPCVWPDGKPE